MNKDSFITQVRLRQKELWPKTRLLADLHADTEAGTLAKCEVIAFISILGGWLDQLDRDALGPEEKADVERQDAENQERWRRGDPGKLRILEELKCPRPRPSAVPSDTDYEPYNQVWFQGATGKAFNEDGSSGVLKPFPWLKVAAAEKADH